MANYQETISQVRLSVANRDLMRPPHGEQLAETVNSLFAAINQRLAQCMVYLRQGQTGEAVRLAKSAPNLGESIEALDIPEMQEWREACRALGLPEQAGIDRAAWETLHKFLINDAPYEDLLKQWRLLNLSKAPLPQRIAALRRVCAKDTGAGVQLVADLKTLENARLSELMEMCRGGAAAADIEAAAAELNEFNDLDTPEALALQTCIRNLDIDRKRAELQERFAVIARELNGAWNNFDRERAAVLAADWEDCVAQNEGAAPAEAEAEAAPVFAWLQEQNERDAAAKRHTRNCAMLSKALEMRAPVEELQALYQTAAVGEIPQEIEQRYREEIASRKTAKRRQRINWSFAAAAAVLLFGAWQAYEFASAARETETGKWKREITTLMNGGNTAAAVMLWDKLAVENPTVAQELNALGARLKIELENNALQQEELKSRQKEAEAERARAAREAAAAAGARRTKLQELQMQYTAVSKLAQDASDKFSVAAAQLQNGLAAAAAEPGAAADTAFQNSIAEMQTGLSKLQTAREKSASAAAAQALLVRMEKIGEQIKTVHSALSAADSAGLAAAQKSLGDLDSARVKLMSEHSDDAALTAAGEALEPRITAAREAAALRAFFWTPVNSIEAVKKLYADFSRSFPGSPVIDSFQEMLKNDYPVWRGAAAWRDLIEKSGGIDKIAAADFQRHLRAYPQTPFYSKAQMLYRYTAAREKNIGGKVWAGFAAKLNDPLLTQVKELRLTDGRMFYVTGPRRSSAENFKFTYTVITGKNFQRDRREQTFGRIELSDPEAREPAHTMLLQKLKELAAAPLTGENWESRGLQIADAVRSAQGANALIRGNLLLAALDIMTESAQWPAELLTILTAQRDYLRGLKFTDFVWLQTADTTVQNTAAQIDAYINGLPAYAPWAAKLTARLPEITPAENIVAYALLLPTAPADGTAGRNRQLSAGKFPAAARQIFAAQAGRTLAEWFKIGDLKDGKAALIPAADRVGDYALVFLTD